MLETSKDLMFIVIAFCILWLTIFLCWMLYYLLKILRNVKEGSEKIDGILQIVKKRIERPTVLLTLAMEGAKQIINFIRERKEGKGKKKKNGKDARD